jgi:HD superfamily phosphohydrolase
LIVVIAIIVVLIKGKSSETNNTTEDSNISFKEQNSMPTKDTEPEPQLKTPKLHNKPQVSDSAQASAVPTPAINKTTQPPQKPPRQPKSDSTQDVNLNNRPQVPQTPQQQKPQNLNQATNQSQNMYKPNPLPNQSQVKKDMANLQTSQQPPNPQPTRINNETQTNQPNKPQPPIQPVQTQPKQPSQTPPAQNINSKPPRE